MGLAYLQIFQDKQELLSPFTREEKGELLEAMMMYAFQGQEIELETNARYIWPVFRQMIDQSCKAFETKSNARKGKANQTESNHIKTYQSESESNQSESNEIKPNQTESNGPINQESRIKNQESRTTRSNEREARARKAAPDVLSSLAPEVQAAFRDFVAMRVKMRKPMTDRAIALAVGKLLEVAGDDPSAQVAAINRTIEYGWQTFYPDDRPAQTARSGTLQPVKRVNAQQYSQREYTNEQLDGLFEVLS